MVLPGPLISDVLPPRRRSLSCIPVRGSGILHIPQPPNAKGSFRSLARVTPRQAPGADPRRSPSNGEVPYGRPIRTLGSTPSQSDPSSKYKRRSQVFSSNFLLSPTCVSLFLPDRTTTPLLTRGLPPRADCCTPHHSSWYLKASGILSSGRAAGTPRLPEFSLWARRPGLRSAGALTPESRRRTF